jgi:hypothetical protein
MASRRSTGKRPEMIHCEYCGEDYAASYKHCPFCDEMGDDFYDEEERPRGGKRLLGGSAPRGGGYGGPPSLLKIIGTVISLALIVAAVIIVISIIKPLVDKGQTTSPPSSPAVTDSASPAPSQSETPAPEDTPTQSPAPTDSPQASPEPSEEIPASQTATGFTINRSDFTLSAAGDKWDLDPTFTPSGTTGTITWVSDKPEVATVDENGVVTAVNKGTANITATMAGGFSQSCIVRCNFAAVSTSGGQTSTSSNTGSLTLNHTDFTFSSPSDPTVSMKVNGTSSTPTWSISDSSVATITAGGVVSPVGSGTATITCKVDGQTLTCIVRCSF